MGVWGAIRKSLGATGEPTRPEHPTFEHLEPRLLLSADPLGLAALNSFDLLDDDRTDAEAAIVVDFEPVASDERTVASGEGLVASEEEAEVTKDGELQSSALVVSSPSESQPAPSAVEGIADDGLQTADVPLPLKSEYLKLNTPTIDSHTEGSIETRGPPTEIVFIDSSLNLDFQLENAVSPDVVVIVYDAGTDGIHHVTDVLSSLFQSLRHPFCVPWSVWLGNLWGSYP